MVLLTNDNLCLSYHFDTCMLAREDDNDLADKNYMPQFPFDSCMPRKDDNDHADKLCLSHHSCMARDDNIVECEDIDDLMRRI